MSIAYKIYERADDAAVARFHAEIGASECPKGFFSWKYLDHPNGAGVAFLAVDGARVVGRVATLPMEIVAGGQRLRAAMQVDLDVLRPYQGTGIFPRLAAMQRRMLVDAEYDVDVGVTTKVAVAVATRHGFRMVGVLRKRVKVLDPWQYAPRRLQALPGVAAAARLLWQSTTCRRKPRAGRGRVEIREVVTLDSTFGPLLDEAASGSIRCVKTIASLRWRYRQCPAGDYRILAAFDAGVPRGLIVLQLFRRHGAVYGNVTDLIHRVEDDRVGADLLQAAAAQFIGDGARSITCWEMGRSPRAALLRSQLYLRRDMPVFLIIRRLRESVDVDALASASNWDLMIGDTDYYLAPRAQAAHEPRDH